ASTTRTATRATPRTTSDAGLPRAPAGSQAPVSAVRVAGRGMSRLSPMPSLANQGVRDLTPAWEGPVPRARPSLDSRHCPPQGCAGLRREERTLRCQARSIAHQGFSLLLYLRQRRLGLG